MNYINMTTDMINRIPEHMSIEDRKDYDDLREQLKEYRLPRDRQIGWVYGNAKGYRTGYTDQNIRDLFRSINDLKFRTIKGNPTYRGYSFPKRDINEDLKQFRAEHWHDEISDDEFAGMRFVDASGIEAQRRAQGTFIDLDQRIEAPEDKIIIKTDEDGFVKVKCSFDWTRNNMSWFSPNSDFSRPVPAPEGSGWMIVGNRPSHAIEALGHAREAVKKVVYRMVAIGKCDTRCAEGKPENHAKCVCACRGLFHGYGPERFKHVGETTLIALGQRSEDVSGEVIYIDGIETDRLIDGATILADGEVPPTGLVWDSEDEPRSMTEIYHNN